MYPSTTFIIEDRSHIEDLQINEQNPAPLFAQFFTSDKGPEEMGEYFGEEFKIFGSPNFARHGQPLLQAQRLINNGARVLAKRVVAPDATLANLILVAHVSSESAQETNEEGYPLYLDENGEETVVSGDTAVISNKCKIEYSLETIEGNLNDIEDLKSSALVFADYENKSGTDVRSYPICVIADNGRGESNKKIRISANTNGSRNKSYLSYIFEVLENGARLESTVFTLNPDIISATSNLSLESVTKTYFNEVRVFSFDDIMRAFITDIKTATGIEDTDNTDILFGKNKKGVGLDAFEIGTNFVRIMDNGQPCIESLLKSGTNGSFGKDPMKSADYTKALLEAFDGTYTNDIFDVDNIILDAIIDANYPDDVKKAIEELIEFREDAFFFRDLGTGLMNGEDIIARADLAAKSRYVGIYGNSYDVIDEYSKKQIHVTTGYSLARVLPRHFSENRHAPVAGSLHGFVFDEIVEGTMNFLPKVIRDKITGNRVDQKEELFAKRVNFISYLDKIPTLESEYTTQEEHTGFSYINNTLAVQRVVKAIRVKCPKNRYSFMEEEDLVKYEEDVQAILNNYTSNFATLKMEYAADKTYEQNMTYYAILYIRFKKFVQAEVFRIIAINNDDVVAAI